MMFRSYCWSLGSTSFRVKDLSYKNEQLLLLLEQFWKTHSTWDKTTQPDFYDLMKSSGLITGEAKLKDKDARQKTSGLHELGLVYQNRRITPVGYAILDNVKKDNFSSNNIFGIESDSYLYLLQLLKLRPSVDIEMDDFYGESSTVHLHTSETYRPFIRLLHLLCYFEYITKDEFTYLLPLLAYNFCDSCLIKDIELVRSGECKIDDILIKEMMRMSNYREALDYFKSVEANNVAIFSDINMSRKSASYDDKLFKIYTLLKDSLLSEEMKEDSAMLVWESLNKEWREYVFKSQCTRFNIRNRKLSECLSDEFINLTDENKFKELFFKVNHLIRWKNTLKDYADLNKRYFKLCDLIYFEGEAIKLDIFAKVFFSLVFYPKGQINRNNIAEQFFSKKVVTEKEDFGLYDLLNIDDLLLQTPSLDSISRELKDKYNIQLETRQDIELHIKNEKINKLEKLIDTKFDNETIIKLLGYFYERGDSDKKIKAEITDNANIPTLFEYVLAIAWHKINGRSGNLLEAMNLSLDIDMLPKSHATGGQADLIFKYEANDIIPQHQLLLEATLSDSTAQRRMELEPVSRHLWHVMKESNNQNDYAILVSTNIHPSVISDFRGRKSMEMTFDDDYFVDGMKMLPISTKMIQFMLANEMTYEQIYQILDNAHNSELTLRQNWYENSIVHYFQ